MAKQTKQTKNSSDDRILFAFLAAFLSIVGFIIALLAKRDDKYVMFYAKQSLVVFIVAVIGGIIGSVFLIIPVLGWVVYSIINLAILILWIFNWVYALSGEAKETPIVGQFARSINL